jgi:hypothetical protein
MRNELDDLAVFVVKTADLPVLDQVIPDEPQPISIDWINRATNQKMRKTSVQLLLRTLGETEVSPSIVRLRETSGMRFHFRNESDRDRFAAVFKRARASLEVPLHFMTAAMFENLESARVAVKELTDAGIPQEAIYLSWQYENVEPQGASKGHSKRSVAAAVAGGGLAGVIAAGGAIALMSGVSPTVAAGALAASALNGLAGVSAALGATGGAIARMLSDPDVEGRGRDDFQETFKKRSVMVSVDIRVAKGKDQLTDQVLTRLGGRGRNR